MVMGIYFVTYFGGLDVLNGTGMTVGGLTQFIAYAGILYGPLSWMTMLPRRLMRMITGLERVYDVLDEEPDIVDRGEAPSPSMVWISGTSPYTPFIPKSA